jgi:hypothetical protein
MDYLTDIKPLQDQGFSDADIVLHLNAKTARPMQPDGSRYVLQDTGAVLTDPVTPDQRTGSLISYYQALPDGDAKKLIAFFISRIYGGEVVRTDQWPRSVQFKSVEDSLPTELQSVSAKLVELAGGRAVPITEADITAAQQAWEDQEAQRLAQEEADFQAAREEALRMEEEMRQLELAQEHSRKAQSLWNIHVAPLMDSIEAPVTDGAVWQAALQTMANEWTA